ncbi:DUF2254 family protein [Solirubrobacter ginsenosidimutans]|nr:DUF2254 family protein [Solirubrobacter ginsenosidimutans]
MHRGAALLHRRRLRTAVVQAVYVFAAVGLGLLVPTVSVGATVDSGRVTEVLVAIGAAFVPFIAIIYSLLFIVVQFSATAFTPRLNLFRDSPIVWHGFSFFTSVIVFAFTASFTIDKDTQTTVLVPIVITVLVLVALVMFRALQASAFKSIQLASTLSAVARRGREVVNDVYPEQTTEGPAAPAAHDAGDVRWPRRAGTLQGIDVPALVRCAERADVVIELCVQPGKVIHQHGRVALVHGAGTVAAHEVIRSLHTGIERTFDQDPTMALRVFADIALRALSPGINDPTTAIQALDEIDTLLRQIVARDLALETVNGSDGQPRVKLQLPTWDDFLTVALDEIIAISPSWPVQRRVEQLLTDLIEIAPAEHAEALRARSDPPQPQDPR